MLNKEIILSDGSFLSQIYDSKNRKGSKPIQVRVIEYTLQNSQDPRNIYRLLTTLLDHKKFPAQELTSLYHERWESEISIKEFKIGLKSNSTLIRSKKPDLVTQEIWGLLMVHFAVRSLMNQASFNSKIDTDRLSFIKSVRIIKDALPRLAAFPPSEVKNK
jgi:hypothetical protein